MATNKRFASKNQKNWVGRRGGGGGGVEGAVLQILKYA